ncbi:hypothetical protein Lser_V15G20836 [Lactuca serriola]
MDLPRLIHDFLLVFLGLGLILGGLGVVLLPNPIYSVFSLGLVFVCICLFYILSNSHFVAAVQLLIYVGAINVLIIFGVMFLNGSEYSKDFHLWIVGDGITSVVCTSLFVSLITTIPNTSCNMWYTICICMLELLLTTYAFYYHFQLDDPLIQLVEDYKWINFFDFRWKLGIDRLSIGPILLIGFITTLATLAAGPVTRDS